MSSSFEEFSRRMAQGGHAPPDERDRPSGTTAGGSGYDGSDEDEEVGGSDVEDDPTATTISKSAQMRDFLETAFPGYKKGGPQNFFGQFIPHHTALARDAGLPNLLQVKDSRSLCAAEIDGLRHLASHALWHLNSEKGTVAKERKPSRPKDQPRPEPKQQSGTINAHTCKASENSPEVQAVYDTHTGTVSIAANFNAQTEILSQNQWRPQRSTFQQPLSQELAPGHVPSDRPYLDPYRHHDALDGFTVTKGLVQDRHQRHFAELARDYDLQDRIRAARENAEGFDGRLSINGVVYCEAKLAELEARVKARQAILSAPLRYVYADDDPFHAEVKLLEDWLARHGGDEPVPGRTLYVAGVMRPCLVCATRLETLFGRMAELGVALVYKKDRSGPAWPTAAALTRISEDDYRKVEARLKDKGTRIAYNPWNDVSVDSESEDDFERLDAKRKRDPEDDGSGKPSESSSTAQSRATAKARPRKKAKKSEHDDEDEYLPEG